MKRAGASVRLTLAGFRTNRPAESKESSFERFVRENEIPEMLWTQSRAVRQWAKKHATKRYVPEYVLTAFHIEVSDDPRGIAQERARF